MSDPTHSLPVVVERSEIVPRESLHPLVAAAMSTGQAPDPAMLRELLAVQREWEAGEARKAYTRDMARVKAELPPVVARDVANPHLKARYTSLALLTDTVTGPLAAYGFSLGYQTEQTPGLVVVTTRVTHHMGHSEVVTLSAPPDKGPGRSEVQAIGSTITYLRRYGLTAILGLATGDMDDADEQKKDPARVDTSANARMAAALAKYGFTREDSEALVDRPMTEWTSADLDKLRAKGAELKAKP